MLDPSSGCIRGRGAAFGKRLLRGGNGRSAQALICRTGAMRRSGGLFMMKSAMLAVAVLGLAGLGACEKAGESIDNAIDDVKGDGRDPSDGAMEKAGEAIDNTVGIDRKDDADAIADAVDGDGTTKPD
jgi:hypothetical protein